MSLGNRRTKQNTKLPDGHPRPQQPRQTPRVAALAQRDSVNSGWAPNCDYILKENYLGYGPYVKPSCRCMKKNTLPRES